MKIGTTEIKKAILGTTAIKKVMLGLTQVWSSSPLLSEVILVASHNNNGRGIRRYLKSDLSFESRTTPTNTDRDSRGWRVVSDGNHIYTLEGEWNTTTGKSVHKYNYSDMSYVGSLQINFSSTVSTDRSMLIDNSYIYVYMYSTTSPASVARISKSDFSTVSYANLTFSGVDNRRRFAQNSSYILCYGYDANYGGILARITKSSMAVSYYTIADSDYGQYSSYSSFIHADDTNVFVSVYDSGREANYLQKIRISDMQGVATDTNFYYSVGSSILTGDSTHLYFTDGGNTLIKYSKSTMSLTASSALGFSSAFSIIVDGTHVYLPAYSGDPTTGGLIYKYLKSNLTRVHTSSEGNYQTQDIFSA